METAAMTATTPPQRPRGIVVFGGGTATNSLVDVFERIREQRGCSLSYVIPISDNGGSSSELIRVFGGPGIGDVRSRLVRLIPDDPSDPDAAEERRSLRRLFNHRLSADPARARIEWLDVVEGRDRRLWRDIDSEKRELIRSIFNLVNLEIVKRARPSSTFNFSKASIGNLFLTGARVFTGSLESGIYLLSTICSIPASVTTLPVINSNFTHHISAGLIDGTVITGQNSISHPSAPTSLPAADDHHENTNNGPGVVSSAISGLLSVPPSTAGTTTNTRSPTPTLTPILTPTPSTLETETEAHDLIEDATLPGSLPTLRKPYINFRKEPPVRGSSGTSGDGAGDEAEEEEQDLCARIDRIWYINPYGHEIRPVPNPKVLSAIRGASAVVYSIGSLYTSIMPSLILRGVGDAIAGIGPTNFTNATVPGGGQTQAHAYPQSKGPRYKILVLNSANDRETGPRASPFTAVDFVRAVARGAGAESRGEYYNRHPASTITPPKNTEAIADPEKEKAEIRRYVTHVIYLESEGAPRVDRDELQGRLGVECVRVYGRRNRDGPGGVLQYDEAGLTRALEAIIGGRPDMARSRRNTSGQ